MVKAVEQEAKKSDADVR